MKYTGDSEKKKGTVLVQSQRGRLYFKGTLTAISPPQIAIQTTVKRPLPFIPQAANKHLHQQ